MKKTFQLIFLVLVFSQSHVFSKNVSHVTEFVKSSSKHKETVRGTLGTYANPPRFEDGRVDHKRLIAELKDIHANTYIWVIPPTHPEDWEALKQFLPLANKAKLKVWVSLRPPSEPPIPQPFGTNYEKWATELAQMSLMEPCLVCWSIDDFSHNQKFFTLEYLGKILAAAHAINPKFAFVPCCYYKAITPDFASNYEHLLNGILFPYRAESVGSNLKDPGEVTNEMTRLRGLFGSEFKIYLDIYATAHSTLGATTPEYVKEVLSFGRRIADGVFIYKHQDPLKSKAKYQIIKNGFKNN